MKNVIVVVPPVWRERPLLGRICIQIRSESPKTTYSYWARNQIKRGQVCLQVCLEGIKFLTIYVKQGSEREKKENMRWLLCVEHMARLQFCVFLIFT